MQENIPRHIAVIPDGNRRWAKARGLAGWRGHEQGVRRTDEVMRAAFAAGVEYFTFWAASVSNLQKRTKVEVAVLTRLLRSYLKQHLDSQELVGKGIRFQLIGRGVEIVRDKKLKELVLALEAQTKQCKQHALTILFGYDGQDEMISALERLRSGQGRITRDIVHTSLWTGELPPVDLVIRTGGEPHNSAGFMMWHTADSQLYFTNTFWPDFTARAFTQSLGEFQHRERRMGR